MTKGFHLFQRTLAFCRIDYRQRFILPLLLCPQEYLALCRCSHSKPSSSANNLSDSWTSLLFLNRAFFSLMINSTFSISSSTDLIASICSWKVLFTSGLLSWLICSFRKDILSSIICCRVTITIYDISLVKPSSKWLVITWMPLKGEGVVVVYHMVNIEGEHERHW